MALLLDTEKISWTARANDDSLFLGSVPSSDFDRIKGNGAFRITSE